MPVIRNKKINNRKVKPRPKLYPEAMTTLGIRKDAQTMTWDNMSDGYVKGIEANPNMTIGERKDAIEDLTEIVSMFQDYAENIHDNFDEGTGFSLFGNNDNGKTTIASVLLREAYRARYTVKLITAEELSVLSRDFDNPESLDELEKIVNEYDFLVIDEIGKETEGKSKYNQIILERVLKTRIEKLQLPTITITNLDPNDFRERYGNTIYSVIQYLQPIVITYSLYFRKPRKIIRKKVKK